MLATAVIAVVAVFVIKLLLSKLAPGLAQYL